MKHSPTSSEFLECVQQEFRFLVDEFGFTVSIPPAPGGGGEQFEIIYHSRLLNISITGINYGFDVQVLFTPFQTDSVFPLKHVSLWGIARLRCPDELEKCRGVSGQLSEVQFCARLLRMCAADVLRGDFTILPSAWAAEEDAARVREAIKPHLP